MMLERKTDRSNNRDASSYYTQSAHFGRRKMMLRSEKIRGLKPPRNLSLHIETLKFLRINIDFFLHPKSARLLQDEVALSLTPPPLKQASKGSVLSSSLVACNQEFGSYGIPSY